MKRSVAVLGKTPSFLRWAIEHPCSLRDCDVDNLADATFRQLRSVTELSHGIDEGRVFENICIARDSAITIGDEDFGSILGFPADEVYDLYGDAEALSAECHDCPANCQPMEQSPRWAGCYGWLPTVLSFSFDQSVKLTPGPHDDLVHLINQIYFEMATTPAILPPLPTARAQPFYLFWRCSWIDPSMLNCMHQIFERAVDLVPGHIELSRFAQAIESASAAKLRLFVELVPRGESDGVHWRRNAACTLCGFDGEVSNESFSAVCAGCGTDAARGNFRKSKVLGRRPFLNLEKVLSPQGAIEFAQRYRQSRDESNDQ